MSANDDNPRLQCERCGKWRRLITRGKQCMFPYTADMDGFKGDRDYWCICTWCQQELEAAPAHNTENPVLTAPSNPKENEK